jgi:hypothetical protein
MENAKELKTVLFHREHMLKRPSQKHLLTLEDADEHKLPAMDKLLRIMFKFNAELDAVGLKRKVDKNDQYPHKNLFDLTDIEYSDFAEFKIMAKSNWFDPKWGTAIHGGFKFYLHVVQDGFEGRYEIADWITIHICHLNTTPMSFVSTREHVKVLGRFLKDSSDLYFRDIPMKYETRVNTDRMKDGLSFKTEAFNEAVNDACKVMQKIIMRKEYLRAI